MDAKSAISGVVSGIQYRDLVDQIIKFESQPADRLRAQVARFTSQRTAVGTYRGLVQALQDAARTLRTGSAFDKVAASTAVTAGTRAVVSASAASAAPAGSYRVEVTQLAQAQKLGATAVTGNATPLGLAGALSLNGTASVTVTATDTLGDLRDKINAVAATSGVTASVLTVTAGEYRLVLTSRQPGAAGLTLADTSGTVLQSLGLLTDATTLNSAAVLVEGRNALFTVDGVDFETTSNVVTDAIEGVTLTLAAADPGAVTTVTVDRSLDAARTAVQGFVDAYNALGDFIRQQGTATGGNEPPLYGDSLLRLPRAGLPSALLQSVSGAAGDLSTAAMAGLSLDRTGRLTLDATRFDAAFTDRPADLRHLFQQAGTTTNPSTYYVTSTSRTAAGTWAVNISQAATQAQVTGTGLGGSYSDDGTPDTMTVTDTALGRSADVTLTAGMTAGQIVTALNDAFAAGGLGLAASEVSGEVRITQNSYGSSGGIQVAYTAGGSLGGVPIAAGTYANGLDVAGTINGETANGSGQVLIAATGTSVEGLSIRYAGAAAGPAGDVTVSLGAGAAIERLLQQYTETGTGVLASRETGLGTRIDSLSDRASRMDSRMALRRESLLRQFAQMETALGRLQSQSQSLLASLGAMLKAGGGQ